MYFEWIIDQFIKFSLRAYPDATAKSSLEKLKEEIKEVENELMEGAIYNIAEEYADCLMCVYHSASKAGIQPKVLMNAFADKLAKNEKRKWVKNANNTYSHVK
jgi:NTP pyrophosphatase (non-canonical NTP hydrolase)